MLVATYSHSIINGTCKPLSHIELFPVSSISTVRSTVICIWYPKLAFSIYRHVSLTIDSLLHLPLQDRSASIGTYRWQRFSRPAIVQYLSLPIGGKCASIRTWATPNAIQRSAQDIPIGNLQHLSHAGHKAVLFRSGADNGSSDNPESSKHEQLMRVRSG